MPTDLQPPPDRTVEAPTEPGAPVPTTRRRVPADTSRRVRRNRWILLAALALVALVAALLLAAGGGHPGGGPAHGHTAGTAGHRPAPRGDPRLEPDWDGDGKPVTFAFGGDVNFPATSNLGARLADDPATALGPTVPQLLSGATLSMTNFESSLTDGTCPTPQPKTYVFYAPPTALTAFEHAGVTLITNTNNHGEDCGPGGLQQALAIKAKAHIPILGIGGNVSEAFTPYEATIKGERIAIVAATQVIDSDLQSTWTATDTQPGLASAYDVNTLVSTVEKVRRWADTVIVYLHWGTELDDCPNPLQEPLANALVRAGADIVVGTHAHVLLGGGYLGTAYVDYGLGNFAFYNNTPPENQSGSLVVTATGRHIDDVTWRPAVIVDDLPQPLTGATASAAVAAWAAHRSCTDVAAGPGNPLATVATETSPATAAVAQKLSDDAT